MVPSYGPLETKQLLSETFFSPGLGFRDIRLDGLKWATLYVKIIEIGEVVRKVHNYHIFNYIKFLIDQMNVLKQALLSSNILKKQFSI